jgi:hypothetical protein
VTAWEHRSVVVRLGDDGPLNHLGAEGWEPYAAMPSYLYGGTGALDVDTIIVALKRAR